MLIQKNMNVKKEKINLGIELLRMILSFWVLSFHCLEKNKINYFIFYITKTKFYHVPCFCFISFYFSYSVFFDRNSLKLKKRLERLLIPYIIWPLFIFSIYNIFIKSTISLYQLKLQIILGRKFLIPLWYLFSMIFLTIFFFILSNVFQIHFLFSIELLGIFSYILQYSNYYKLLDEYDNSVKKPILDTLSILPLSVTGLIFASSKKVETLKSGTKSILFFCYFFIYFLFKYDIFLDLGGYDGIVNIFSSILFFLGFYLLPLENTSSSIKTIIKQITSYTNGIYCMQSKMIPFVKKTFNLEGTLKSCIITYLLSYFISFVGVKIFIKSKLKYLFL